MQVVSKYCEDKNEKRETWDIVVWYTPENLIMLKPNGDETVGEFIIRSVHKEFFPNTTLTYGHINSFNVSERYPFFRIIIKFDKHYSNQKE